MAVSESVTFGDLLKQLRKRGGMTQADLAAAVGYSVPFISNLELNQRLPDLQAVKQRFIPALGLQEEPQLATRLLELAAAARGEELPAAVGPKSERGRLLPDEPAAHPASLPQPPTELLGRAQEVKNICNRLLGHGNRLLTLIGPPGIGKTRLGLAVAEKLCAVYRDGVYFVPLASINDAELVASTLVFELGINATDERAPKARLIDFLRRKEALLLLDNFEQVTAAAPLVAELLAACAGICVLVTSRERLHLRAEQRFRVPPLEVEAAVALFVQRAQVVAADFALTPENQPHLTKICHLLDCLPLAIELSAARIDLFTPETLLARLRDRRLDLLSDGPYDLPPHQRTLRNAIHRSYSLLDAREQSLFRSLGVFVGGFEPEAVAELGGDETNLHSLIHKSLVQVTTRNDGARRILLLETLREYAWEQLCAHGEATATQLRHSAVYLGLAEEAAKHLRGAEQGIWLERLELDHANLRAALAFSLAEQQTDNAVRLGIALWRFWYVRGHYEEGCQWLEEILAVAGDPAQRAKLLYARGMLARLQGEISAAGDNLTASLALFRQLDDMRGIASSLRGLGFVHYVQYDIEGARSLLEEALARFRALDDLEGIAVTLDNLAYITDDEAEEKALFQESLGLRRRSGNLRGITMSLAGLASAAIYLEEYTTARLYLQEHLQINEELGNKTGIATSNYMLGDVAMGEGDFTTARSLFEQCIKLCQATGNRLLLPTASLGLCIAMLLSGDDEGICPLLEDALLRVQEQGKILDTAEALTLFANLAVRQGVPERALSLIAAAEVNCITLTKLVRPMRQRLIARTQAAARQMLDPKTAAAAWKKGQAMTLEQAVAYALAKPQA